MPVLRPARILVFFASAVLCGTAVCAQSGSECLKAAFESMKGEAHVRMMFKDDFPGLYEDHSKCAEGYPSCNYIIVSKPSVMPIPLVSAYTAMRDCLKVKYRNSVEVPGERRHLYANGTNDFCRVGFIDEKPVDQGGSVWTLHAACRKDP